MIKLEVRFKASPPEGAAVPDLPDTLTIGELAARSGIATSAIRYYDRMGLLCSDRSSGNQRRFPRGELRRVAFIRIAQRVGLSLEEIREALAMLPDGRTPTRGDWARLSRVWRSRLDDQIHLMERLRDRLASCIGCGCLSLKRCELSNPHDVLAVNGPGPRYLLGDTGPGRPGTDRC
jgi:MerR family redox-sensitive transcriptional activator SoxR